MDGPRKRSGGQGKKPETKIQEDIITMLQGKGWFCMVTVGNMYQSGFPDIFACHTRFGHRWIEVKRADGNSRLEASQMENFPKLCAHGSGVWILTAATEHEYRKLVSAPCNWHTFIKW